MEVRGGAVVMIAGMHRRTVSSCSDGQTASGSRFISPTSVRHFRFTKDSFGGRDGRSYCLHLGQQHGSRLKFRHPALVPKRAPLLAAARSVEPTKQAPSEGLSAVDLKELRASPAPSSPGVYAVLDEEQQVQYIGFVICLLHHPSPFCSARLQVRSQLMKTLPA
jgi:hypothetical protein